MYNMVQIDSRCFLTAIIPPVVSHQPGRNNVTTGEDCDVLRNEDVLLIL